MQYGRLVEDKEASNSSKVGWCSRDRRWAAWSKAVKRNASVDNETVFEDIWGEPGGSQRKIQSNYILIFE